MLVQPLNPEDDQNGSAGDPVDVETRPSHYNVKVPLRGGRALLFNSRTQHLAVLSAEEIDCLEAEDPSTNIPYPFLRALVSAGFHVPVDGDELGRVTTHFETSRRSGDHLNLTIAATLNCNLACGYCFQGQNKPAKRMDDAVQGKLIAFVEGRLDEVKSLNLTWYGGEPLMNPQEIWRTASAIKSLCAEKGVSFSSFIITNGFLLTSGIARMLVEHGVFGAQVTVDGLGEDHDRMRPHISGRGSFERILANVEDVLANSTLAISLRISVDTENSSGVVALLNFLSERELARTGRFSVYFAQIEAISSGCSDYEPMSLSKQKYAQLEVELLRLAVSLKLKTHTFFGQNLSLCQAVRPNDLIITPNGDLHKCWDTVSYGDLKIGNIAQENAREALSDNLWTDWVPTRNPICQACKILPICGGGCAFKTVHPGEMSGEAAALPCISLKFNLAERLFDVALASGTVQADEWDPVFSPTTVAGKLKTGERHSYESMRAASALYVSKTPTQGSEEYASTLV
jgi:uncharacterized protein